MNWFRTAQKKDIYLEESQPQDKDGRGKVNNIEPGTVHLNKKELMKMWIGYQTKTNFFNASTKPFTGFGAVPCRSESAKLELRVKLKHTDLYHSGNEIIKLCVIRPVCCGSVTFWYGSRSGSLTNGSRSGYFCQWPSRRRENIIFWRYIYIIFIF